MDYKNDERYWDIKLLNKWFFIAAGIWSISMVWMFVFDNDDEFKYYQKEYFKKLKHKTLINYENLVKEKQGHKIVLEEKISNALSDLDSKASIILSLNDSLRSLNDVFAKVDIEYKATNVEVDVAKYHFEEDRLHSKNEIELKSKKIYDRYIAERNQLKIDKEDIEIKIGNITKSIADIKSGYLDAQGIRNNDLKDLDLVEKQLKSLDRDRMTLANKIADVVRDLPIIDFMDPRFKVHQLVLNDIKYDVNFTLVPTVDRCMSCHMGIEKYEFHEEDHPFASHPNLELFVSTSSPHPLNEFGCTSCHSGRGRGTDFISTVHMPNNHIQEEEWIEKYDWEKLHHWLQPMLPSKYSEAGCFKCHTNQPYKEGGEKLQLGLSLMQKHGCNGCHHIESFPKQYNVGPDLTNLDKKVDKEWVFKWIRDPQSFRYNTYMPHFFSQDNNSSPEMARRTNAEIYAITEFLYQNKEYTNPTPSITGDKDNGEILFSSIGCMGCHMINEEIIDYEGDNHDYEPFVSKHGYDEETNNYTLLKQQGPNLIGLGSKVNDEWLYNWIKNPKNYWSETRMPNLRLSDKEARDITAYLMSFNNNDFDSQMIPELNQIHFTDELQNIAIGWLNKSFNYQEAEKKLEELIDKGDLINYVADKSIRFYGCYSCHNIDGYDNVKPIGAELTQEASKPIDKLDFGYQHQLHHTNYSWFSQKLANPRIFDRNKIIDPENKSRMPNFYLTEHEIDAIVTAILGLTDSRIEETKIADLDKSDQVLEGYKLLRKFNCYGCHDINEEGGQIADAIRETLPEGIEDAYLNYSPPSLKSEGQKVQTNWLFDFLKNPTTIRPNIQVRMPSFDLNDDEWNAIISAFQDIDNHELSFESTHMVDVNSEKFKHGYELVSDQMYDFDKDVYLDELIEGSRCFGCHFQGDDPPGDWDVSDPVVWAPNLSLTKERLRPEWVKEWLRNPQHFMDYTNMVAPVLYNRCPTCIDYKMSQAHFDSLVNISDNKLVDNWRSGSIADYRLEAIRDWIYQLDGKTDISVRIKSYFDENGYEHLQKGEEDEWGW